MALTRTKWYLINIKARTKQKPSHYYDALIKLKEEDPLILVSEDKAIVLDNISSNGIFNPDLNAPDWMAIKLVSFTIIDKDAFYDRRQRKEISIEWNDDWVSNKREEEFLFSFSNHTLAVRKTSKISLNRVVLFFQKALEKIEPETFDVNIVSDKGIIDKIISAHSIIKIDAHISFGNPGHTLGFNQVFQNKVRECNPEKLNIQVEGTKTTPLNNARDGLIEAIVNSAQRDGTVTAVIQENQGGEYTTINTSEHPRVINVDADRGSYWPSVWNTIKSVFKNE